MRWLLLSLVVLTACRQLPADHAEVRAKVMAADGRIGVTCYVEINSTPPFLTPESVEVKTGSEFRHIMTTSGVMERMYAAVRCPGYATRVSDMFSLARGQRVDLGDLIVTRE